MTHDTLALCSSVLFHNFLSINCPACPDCMHLHYASAPCICTMHLHAISTSFHPHASIIPLPQVYLSPPCPPPPTRGPSSYWISPFEFSPTPLWHHPGAPAPPAQRLPTVSNDPYSALAPPVTPTPFQTTPTHPCSKSEFTSTLEPTSRGIFTFSKEVVSQEQRYLDGHANIPPRLL